MVETKATADEVWKYISDNQDDHYSMIANHFNTTEKTIRDMSIHWELGDREGFAEIWDKATNPPPTS